MYTSMASTSDIRKTYSDQTVKFPLQSSRGHNYVFILYGYDYNAIVSVPLKNRQAKLIADAWQNFFSQLKDNGYTPDLHIIDNECSELLKNSFRKYNINFQRVPPHSHQQNSAEHAIQTWKHHLIAGLATCGLDFLPAEWYRIMPQCNITINLLRSSGRQAKLSIHACLYGNFDLYRSPLAPPGTKVVIHDTVNQRDSLAPHGIEG